VSRTTRAVGAGWIARGSALLTALVGLAPAAVPAAEVAVGAGASMSLGAGQLDLGCADLTVAGTLSAGSQGVAGTRDMVIDPTGVVNGNSATLVVSGDWDNAGTFNAGTSSVQLRDGCGLSSAVIAGDTSFATLDLLSTTGKLYTFTAGSTQTVSQSFAVNGAPGNLLTIRSSSPGNAAFLDAQGSAGGDYVDVQDNQAIGNNIGVGANSVIGTNTAGWFVSAVVPALPFAGSAVLALALAWAVRQSLAPRGRAAG
jgi:hypothetical protein